ncbi:MAG: hypothetical protein NT166_14555 [Candidatus Aminicenantes bacterium]|nr:hypothetical protein [Candidatus Aminicenantes bacterium]
MTNSNDNKTGFGLSQFQRNRYFYGKLMTVKDFEVEQDYLNEKRHLLNRLVNGVGIICGLTPDDVEISNIGSNIKIKFKTGGAAIDGWGREIVVPIEDNPRDIRIKQGSTQTTLTADHLVNDLVNDTYYLYLEYDPREGEMVSSASESSGCEETCCPSRVIENFQVIASTTPPPPDTLTIACPVFTDEPTEADARKKVKKWLVDQTSKLCGFPMESKIFFLALKKGSALLIDQQTTAKYLTFVANNRALSELLACHISDFGNPHKTTAEQVGALTSVDGVKNPGGDVDLVAQDSISIDPNDTANTITIGETHSGITGNPHGTNHSQLNGVQWARAVGPNQDKHIAAQDVVKWDSAVYKVGGVQPNAAGEILITAGSNIIINSTGLNEITINAVGGTPPPSARTGRAEIPIDDTGKGVISNIDPGLGHSNYCVIVGVIKSASTHYAEYVQFETMDFNGSNVRFEIQVYGGGTKYENQFGIFIVDGHNLTESTSVPIRWWAIPGEVVAAPTATLPTATFTIPTYTFTMPTLTITTPTLTIMPTFTQTIPTLTIIPTFTQTIPTLTVMPTFTQTIPTLTVMPTFTQTIPTLTVMPTLTQTIPTFTIMPTFTQTMPTLTVMPTFTFMPKTTTPTTPTMPTVITPGVGYLADITGIGPVIADKLTAGGITSIAQLAAAAPGHVAEILGYSTTTKAAAFIKEAKNLMGKK